MPSDDRSDAELTKSANGPVIRPQVMGRHDAGKSCRKRPPRSFTSARKRSRWRMASLLTSCSTISVQYCRASCASWTSLDATGNGRFVPGVGTLQGSANTRWISTLAARVGVVLNNGVLLYGKAGGAWVDNNATITNLNTGASISASNRNSGWVVGAGVEWAIAGNWSAKLEYDFVQLDDLTFGPGPFLGNTFTASREIQMFKVGLNYRFGSLFGGGYGGAY